MGTHACTRIQKEKDYIETHTRWDGFPSEIKRNLKNLISLWENTHKELEQNCSKMPATNYLQWIDNLGQFIAKTKANPTLESVCALFCAKSLVHHHVFPVENEASKELNSYWGEGSPDVVAVLQEDKSYLFNKTKKIKTAKSREIESGYSIVRIYKEEKGAYVDVKVKDFDQQEFLNIFFTLPQLWRNIHISTRVPREDNYKTTPILNDYNHKLQYFYNRPKSYGMFDRDIQSKEDIIDNVNSMIPFDLYINALATHLFIASPGKILPLTKGQQNHNLTPVASITILNNRLSILSIDFNEEKTIEQKTDMLYKVVDYLKEDEQLFADMYVVSPEFNTMGLLEDSYSMFIEYEAGLVNYFMSTIEASDNHDIDNTEN